MKKFSIEKSTDLINYVVDVTIMDEGVVIVVGGGISHIGTLILAQPRKSLTGDGTISATSSVINLLGHLDEVPFRREAELLAIKINQPVVVTGGIHLDNINKDDIKKIHLDCREIFQKIAENLKL